MSKSLAEVVTDVPPEMANDMYYMSLVIKRVKDVFTTGWEIERGEKFEEKKRNSEFADLPAALDAQQTMKLGAALMNFDHQIATAVVGLFNRGKTFVLNLITGQNFESGHKYSTKGLSIAVPQNSIAASNLYVIDTEGLNAPLARQAIDDAMEHFPPLVHQTKDPYESGISMDELTKRQKERKLEEAHHFARVKEQAIVAKIATENILQELIFRCADVLVVVVNEMTWDDQQYIEALTKQLVQNPEHVKYRLVVIHNYKNTSTREDFEILRQKYVLSSSYGELQTKPVGNDEVEVFVSTAPEVFHGFLCKHDSEFGAVLNRKTIAWLRQVCFTQRKTTENTFIQHLLVSATAALQNLVRETGSLQLCYEDNKLLIKSNLGKDPKFINDVVEANYTNIVVRSADFVPAMDRIESPTDYTVVLDLPGYSNDRKTRIGDINIKVDEPGKSIIISGKRILYGPSKGETQQYSLGSEVPDDITINSCRKGGPFMFKVDLPPTVRCQPRLAQLNWSHGQLAITLPKIAVNATEEDPSLLA